MKNIIVASTLLICSIGFATANTQAKKEEVAPKPIQEWTCQDFLDVTETYQPTAVGLVQFINEKKDTDKAYLDVDGIETVTPSILEVCKADPKASFSDTYNKVKISKNATK